MQELIIETDEAKFGIQFSLVQLQLTGKCNMSCRHCRAVDQLKNDMPWKQIKKIVNFAKHYGSSEFEIMLSGGEPLLHDNFEHVIGELRHADVQNITLTSNGYFLRPSHIRLIRSLGFKKVVFSISIDSLIPKEHDLFRGTNGAFSSAVRALSIIAEADCKTIVPSLRVSLRPNQIPIMDDFVEYAKNIGCRRISFASIVPAGRAMSDTKLLMNRQQKQSFIEMFWKLRSQEKNIDIYTNDPLSILGGKSYNLNINSDLNISTYGGCVAGTFHFNVNVDGTLTPCPALQTPIMNAYATLQEDMHIQYAKSEIIKKLVSRTFHGKCDNCNLRLECGGCRARAYASAGDYLGEDDNCWLYDNQL